MAISKKYTFRIDGFTLETMPFGRLVSYYNEINRMLDVPDSMHLVSLFESSHGSAFEIDPDTEEKITQRVQDINSGQAPKRAVRARDALNAMLREDGTSGQFFDSTRSNVIEFPGKKSKDDILYQIRDSATFSGELYHIAGNKDDVKIRINTDNYGVVFCTTTKSIGRSIRDFLFENVKVSGRGVWTRSAQGAWDIDDFVITDFAPVNEKGLRSTVDKIRGLDISWPEDPLLEIDKIEETGGQIH